MPDRLITIPDGPRNHLRGMCLQCGHHHLLLPRHIAEDDGTFFTLMLSALTDPCERCEACRPIKSMGRPHYCGPKLLDTTAMVCRGVVRI
jgi:hypothetical protein